MRLHLHVSSSSWQDGTGKTCNQRQAGSFVASALSLGGLMLVMSQQEVGSISHLFSSSASWQSLEALYGADLNFIVSSSVETGKETSTYLFIYLLALIASRLLVEFASG